MKYYLIQAGQLKVGKSDLDLLILEKAMLVFVLALELAHCKHGTIGGHGDHHHNRTFMRRKLPQNYTEPRGGKTDHFGAQSSHT